MALLRQVGFLFQISSECIINNDQIEIADDLFKLKWERIKDMTIVHLPLSHLTGSLLDAVGDHQS